MRGAGLGGGWNRMKQGWVGVGHADLRQDGAEGLEAGDRRELRKGQAGNRAEYGGQ